MEQVDFMARYQNQNQEISVPELQAKPPGKPACLWDMI